MRQYLENVRDTSTLAYGYSIFHMSLLTGTLDNFSAKRGIAIACRLSVCLSVRLSVCDVGEL